MSSPPFSRRYGLGPGFSFRREAFGGILFHFEGKRPDPRLTFVNSPFLVGMLELLDQGPVGELIEAVRAEFALDGDQVGTIREFLSGLSERGALVAQ